KQTADLTGVAMKPSSALAGEVKHQSDVILFARGYLKHLAKGGYFIARHRAIGLGHLGSERDYRNREGDMAAPVALQVRAMAVRKPTRNVARRTCEQGAERAAKGQLSGSGDNTSNKTHLIRSCGCGRVNQFRAIRSRALPLD